MKVYALVTLFNPPADVADNLMTYAADVDGFIFWDNTPGSSRMDWPAAIATKMIHCREGRNVGIGAASTTPQTFVWPTAP